MKIIAVPWTWFAACLLLGSGLTACTEADAPDSDDTAPEADADSDTDTDTDTDTDSDTDTPPSRRVPAEWELHAGTWMQWPGMWETSLRPAFADIIEVLKAYEPVHLLTSTEQEKAEAWAFLAGEGVDDSNLTWHVIPVDSAWMRDNGPVYVEAEGELILLNFAFDAWGGNFGWDVTYEYDNAVPTAVAEYLGIPSEDHLDYVLERGNLEFNGAGTLVLNWDCQDDRNPGLTEEQHEAILTEAFGLERIIWAYGHHPLDGTTGHIDGTARFVDADTIAIAETSWAAETEDALVAACEEAGLEVVRIPCPGETDYMNWLVGNGFVAAMSFDDADADAEAKAVIESLFPDRDVHMLDASTLWNSGGGVHCVTNDQPEGP